MSIHRERFFKEQSETQLRGVLLEGKLDKLVVPLIQELESIFISHLDEPQLSEDLSVHDSQVIVNSLIEDHVVNDGVNLFTHSSDPLYSVNVNVF